MKIDIVKAVEAIETNTQGAHSYVVALMCGGLMEDPEIHYSDYQVIHADSEKEACEKYNSRNNCSFYYGKVLEQLS